LRADFPHIRDRIPEGTPGRSETTYEINHSKAEKVLGIKFTPLNVTLKDTVEDLLRAEGK
jgi:hypothetical protein